MAKRYKPKNFWIIKGGKGRSDRIKYLDPATGKEKRESIRRFGATLAEAEPGLRNFDLELGRIYAEIRQNPHASQRLKQEHEREKVLSRPVLDIVREFLDEYGVSHGERVTAQLASLLARFTDWLESQSPALTGATLDTAQLHRFADHMRTLKQRRDPSRYLSASSLNGIRRDVIRCLNWARKRKLIALTKDEIGESIPTFKPREGETSKGVVRIPSAELRKLIRAARELDATRHFASRTDKQAYHSGEPQAAGSHKYAPIGDFLILLMLTGMRRGEALHLRWDAVDFERKTIRIQDDPASGWSVKTRETRDLAFASSPALLAHLRALKLQSGGSPYVLRGAGLKPREWQAREWQRLLDRAGLSDSRYSPQSLRSTFASACALGRGGPSPHALSGIMGHGIHVAAKHYIKGAEMIEGTCIEEWLCVADELRERDNIPTRLVNA